MKKYRKPIIKVVILDPEELLLIPDSQSLNPVGVKNGKLWGNAFNGEDVSYSGQGGYVTDDEYPGGDISYSKGIFRGSEEISEDATIVNHY